jgi:hypothetical protein
MLQGPAPVLLVRPDKLTEVVSTARGRRCDNCGRALPGMTVAAGDRCLRCGHHLHTCANCVYLHGDGCLLKRKELHDTQPGEECPAFQFRETPKGLPNEHKS